MIYNQQQQDYQNMLDDELIIQLQKQMQAGRQVRQPLNTNIIPNASVSSAQLDNAFNLPPQHAGDFFQGLMPIQESNVNVDGALTQSTSLQAPLPKCYSADSVASNSSLMSYESAAIAREYENFLLHMANNISNNNNGGGGLCTKPHQIFSGAPGASIDQVAGTSKRDHRTSSNSATASSASLSSSTTTSRMPQLVDSNGSSAGSSDDKETKVEMEDSLLSLNGEKMTMLKTSNTKVNVDPIKRTKSDPGTTLDDIINSGIDPNKLHPQVLRRIKNTDAARRSRMKKQAKMKEMEDVLGGQRSEISQLREVTELLRQELKNLRIESENIKINYCRLRSFLASKGVRIPAELELDLR